MASFDFSKLNFFTKLDARARVFVLFGGVIGFIFLVYIGTKYLVGTSRTVGPSHVATAPSGLQSVPGGQVTSEYYKALVQANQQRVQQASMTGQSAVATLINPGEATSNGSCVICYEQNANVKDLLDDWVRSGKISPEVAQELEDLANKNVPVSEYAAELAQLVKEGKLTPEQARELLEQYKKQHANAALADSAKYMDNLIKSGQLPVDVANELLDAQKRGVSPAEYAAMLQQLVKEGKISPELAQQLLAQYAQQRAKEAAAENQATIAEMARNGEITPDVAAQLADLAKRGVSVDDYAAALQRLVAEGKLTPAAAAKLLAAYQATKLGQNAIDQMKKLVSAAENAAYQEISDLLKAGRITAAVAQELTGLIQKNITIDQYKTAVMQMVAQKQLTPDIAQLKIGDYTKVKNLRDEEARLEALQARGATAAEFAAELRRAVAAGIITPDEAAQMLQSYQALTQPPATTVPGATGGAAFANLQSRLQQAPATPAPTSANFSAEQLQAQQQAAQNQQNAIQTLMGQMQTQAGQLITAWEPPTMKYTEGSSTQAGGAAAGTSTSSTTSSSSSSSTTTTGPATAPLIKAGTIIFGVLDTEANSDYPDSPIMVTIVEGPYKGAKLLGKLQTTKGVAGQQNRIALNFSMMNLDAWLSSKTVTAYAIDPDTARSALATSVNNHYLVRYGAIFATSLLQGYSTAIQTSASTSTTGIFGTSTSHPELSPSEKLGVALGQIGQNLSTTTQNWINIPPTVKIKAGVSLGILFMADVAS